MHRAEWMASHHDDALTDAPRLGMPPAVRLWLPVIVSFVAQVPVALALLLQGGEWQWRGGGPWVNMGRPPGLDAQGWEVQVWDPQSSAVLGLALAVAGTVALLAARRYPGPVVAFVAAAASADLLFVPQAGPPFVALGFAIMLGLVRGARVWVLVSAAAVWLLGVAGPVLTGGGVSPFQVVGLTVGLLVCLGVGAGIRGRRERIHASRIQAEQRRVDATQQERVRIARELHDVLAHSLSQISVQAGVGLHLIERQPEKAAEALSNIKLTSKTALDEVRGVLGLLRDGDGAAPLIPEAELSMVQGLADRAADAGLTVTLRNTIESSPPAAVQLALYRLVQESVTNVLRHAAASELSIRLAEEGGDYVVEVIDDGHGVTDAEGRGILGMRERAELLGGTLSIGPARASAAATPGVRVLATIPVKGLR